MLYLYIYLYGLYKFNIYNMTQEEKIEFAAQEFLSGRKTLSELKKELNLENTKGIVDKINNLGYYMGPRMRSSTVINLKKAVDEYIKDYNNKPSISKLSRKYKISSENISNVLKSLGYEIINHQNKLKFDETVFDSIDNEEKAYWLGFIFADGYISAYDSDGKNRFNFELSLKGSDKEHLDKFNVFMKHEDPNHVKIGESKCFNTGSSCSRCRWSIVNKHLWETLNSYGCTPKKLLTLTFPNTSIFKDKSLIKHFIRGYWDGDGCLSYFNKNHTKACISVLGTYEFLTELKNNLPLKTDYVLSNNNSNKDITKVLQLGGKNAFELCYYLYEDSKIYLNRKYNKYLEYCRLYEESYILLQIKNGKIRIDNSVLNSETKKSESV